MYCLDTKLTIDSLGNINRFIKSFIYHVLVPIPGTWHLLSAPLLLALLNIKIIIFSFDFVLSTFLRWLKVINRASALFNTINTLLIHTHISNDEIIF